jgi:hypothetical protein
MAPRHIQRQHSHADNNCRCGSLVAPGSPASTLSRTAVTPVSRASAHEQRFAPKVVSSDLLACGCTQKPVLPPDIDSDGRAVRWDRRTGERWMKGEFGNPATGRRQHVKGMLGGRCRT